MLTTIEINLSERSYNVDIGPGLLGSIGTRIHSLGKVSSVVVISDSNVAGLYGRRVIDSLTAESLPANLLTFPAGEENKTLATCSDIYDKIFALRPAVDRNAVIITLGGGVTGDMGGFIAATLLRGVRFYQCPTSLLAAVDASVGGKTGIDHAAGKNLIGAFYQPCGVLIDVETLNSLPADHIASGMAECVKHAVIRDGQLLAMIDDSVDDLKAVKPNAMVDLIARNVAIKAKIVSADERESNLREILNLGHTFGHAIETAAGFGAVSHGQAIALGMVSACRASVELGHMTNSDANRVEAVLARLGLAVRRDGMDADELCELMKHDKKNRGGVIRFVLPVAIGDARVFDDVPESVVKSAIAYINK